MGKRLDINRVVLIGRTFAEYHKMFSLKDFPYPEEEKFLDAAGGVSSFCAEACAAGWNAVSADEIYYLDAATIEKKCSADLLEVMNKLEPVKDLYRWVLFKDISGLRANREKAYKAFIEDYLQAGNKRYVNARFPGSPFTDNEFSVTLVSHFLFLYEKEISYEDHKDILRELLRITSKEIRIFPVTNFEGKRSAHLERFLEDPAFASVQKEVKRAGYEFLKGANEFLSLKKEKETRREE